MTSISNPFPENGSSVGAVSKGNTLGTNEHVDAWLTYLAPMSTKPFTHKYAPSASEPQRSGHDFPCKVKIRNGRRSAKGFSIDKEGFELVDFPTRVTHFYDESEIKSIYYPEITHQIKRLTGAARVIISNHIVRAAGRQLRESTSTQGPSWRVHNDFTTSSAPRRVRDLLGEAEAERLLQYRFAVINVWRSLITPLKHMPLALCDAESVQLNDLVTTDLILRGRVSETYRLNYNADHRWYYFPDIQQDEAILIKCYDTDSRRARFTPHAAFDDPATPPDAPPRESIEVRTFAFFEA